MTTATPPPGEPIAPHAEDHPRADDDALPAQVPVLSKGGPRGAAPAAEADPMRSERAWVVSNGIKALFTWCAFGMVVGLIAYKVEERMRYQSILVETVMDPVPISTPSIPFSLPLGDATGTQVRLEDFRGKYVFVNFWATWCPPCREEMPSMEFMARKFGSKMEILAITVDEDWGEVQRFFGNDKPSFKVLWDPKRQVPRSYGTEKFPESFLVDPQGRVVAKFIGPRDWNNQAADEYFRKLVGG